MLSSTSNQLTDFKQLTVMLLEHTPKLGRKLSYREGKLLTVQPECACARVCRYCTFERVYKAVSKGPQSLRNISEFNLGKLYFMHLSVIG